MVYRKVCEVCGKRVEAMTEVQAEWNLKVHKMTHNHATASPAGPDSKGASGRKKKGGKAK